MKHLLACLLALLVATTSVLAKGSDWKEHYDKAVVATFYAGNVLNGYHELTLAQAYVDSAQMELDAIAVPDSAGLAAVADLRNELSISEEIAVDNLNYIYPAFSVFTSEHQEYNIVDDPAELLLEALTEKVVELQDPLFKGTVNENGEFVIVQVTPFDAMHVNVLLDFMSLNTPAYAIRLHEYANFLDPAGIERYQEGTMTTADLEAACDYYGVTRILILRLRDNGSIIPDAENPTVFYKGVTLEAFRSGDEAVKDYFYFETFRIDKATGWYRGVVTLVLGALILLVALLLMGGAYKKENRWQWEASRVLRVEEVKRSLVVLAMSISGAYFAHLVGGWWAPGPNAFFGEMHSRAWLAYTAFAPFLFAVVQSYVALFKLANGKMDDAGNFARMIMGGLVAHLVYMDYFEEFAPVMADSMVGSPAWFAPFLFLLPSLCMGDVWERVKVKNLMGGLRWGAFAVTLLASVFVLFADFRHEPLWMWTGVGIAQIGALVLLVLVRGRATFSKEHQLDHSYAHPHQFLEIGVNVAETRRVLKRFVFPNHDEHEVGYLKEQIPLLMVVHGEQGMGKTRLLKELSEWEKVQFYYGDFNEDLEGAAAMYNPLKEAFEGTLVEGNAFFEDRSEMGNKLSGLVAQAAGSYVPLDLESLLVSDGDQHTVSEISQGLCDALIGRAEKGMTQVVVIDHYDWVETDPASHNLIKVMLERLMRERKQAERLRVILVSDQTETEKFPVPLQSLREETCELRETTFEVGWIGSNGEEKIRSRAGFVERVCSRQGIVMETEGNVCKFNPALVTHLRSKCLDDAPEFTPGDFFSYLDGLNKGGFIQQFGDRIDLKGNPEQAALSLSKGKVAAVIQRLEQLDDGDRRLLGAAAHIGFKFDAEILAGIWEEDVLNIIAQLVRLEKLEFVKDLDKEDNVYSFWNRESHQAIKAHDKGSDERFTQLLVEYQKRTIALMRKGGDVYVHSLDPEILGNAADHCLNPNFAGVAIIRQQAPYILLHAGMAALKTGRSDRAEKWFSRVVDDRLHWPVSVFSEENRALPPASLLGSFLTIAFETGANGLAELDSIQEGGTGRLDLILNRLDEVEDERMRERILLALQRDAQRRMPKWFDVGKEPKLDALWSRRRKAIGAAYTALRQPEEPLRFEFYELLIDNAGVELLSPLLKSIESQPQTGMMRQLRGEVLRHMVLKTSGEDQERHAMTALVIEAQASGMRGTPESLNNWSDALELLDQLMQLGWHTTNLNMTCSRLRDVAYARGEYRTVLTLCKHAETLSKVLSDRTGMERALSSSGAAHFQLGEHEKSIEAYQEYAKLLMKRDAKNEDYSFVIEGILRNCRAISDHSAFHALKDDLYDHLRFITSEMKAKERYSMFEKSVSLAALLPDKNRTRDEKQWEEDPELAESILQILSCVALADNHLDDAELHDLEESGVALAYRFGLNPDQVRKLAKEVVQGVEASQPDRPQTLMRALDGLIQKRPQGGLLRAVLRLCDDMARADGKVTDQESAVIQQIRTRILNS